MVYGQTGGNVNIPQQTNYNNYGGKRTSDTLALVSLIIGIISLAGFCCLGGFLGIIGIILSIIALMYNNKRKLIIVSLIINSLAIVLTILFILTPSNNPEWNPNNNYLLPEEKRTFSEKVQDKIDGVIDTLFDNDFTKVN